MPLRQMPAAIPEAERPDEPPVKPIQTTINNKITPPVSVRYRAPPHAIPCVRTRAQHEPCRDIAQQHLLIA